MPKSRYTSEYFYEQLQKLRSIISLSKNYKTIKELMNSKNNVVELNHVNASQGLEK